MIRCHPPGDCRRFLFLPSANPPLDGDSDFIVEGTVKDDADGMTGGWINDTIEGSAGGDVDVQIDP